MEKISRISLAMFATLNGNKTYNQSHSTLFFYNLSHRIHV